MTGTHLLIPFVIGKHKNPRCFKKSTKKTCFYRLNEPALMKLKIFYDYMTELNLKLKK